MSRPTTYPNKRLLLLDDELKELIEEFRFAYRYKTESDAMRDLLLAGLGVKGITPATLAESKKRQKKAQP